VSTKGKYGVVALQSDRPHGVRYVVGFGLSQVVDHSTLIYHGVESDGLVFYFYLLQNFFISL